jgi:uncharacterized protein
MRFVVLVLIALLLLPVLADAAKKTAAPAAAPAAAPKEKEFQNTPEELAAAAKNPLVQDNVAVIFAEGKGVPRNYTYAAMWFRRAADQGDLFAQTSLAYLYTKGLGVPLDLSEAATWYYKAAIQGDAKSEYHLGTIYYLGIGVPKNHLMAIDWFRQASAAGDQDATYYLNKITDYRAFKTHHSLGLPGSLSDALADEEENEPENGLGLVFLEGAGAELSIEAALYWVLIPLASFIAI